MEEPIIIIIMGYLFAHTQSACVGLESFANTRTVSLDNYVDDQNVHLGVGGYMYVQWILSMGPQGALVYISTCNSSVRQYV